MKVLKKYNTWLLTEEEKRTLEIIFNKFIEQLEPKENFRINRLKWMTLNDFVNRCRRMTQRCSLTEHEQQQRKIELIIASTPIADFQKELLRKNKTLTLEETVSIGKTYQASNIHIKQLRAMVNNNNVDNTNIQAIRTPTHSTMSNKCLKCSESHAFHREACPEFGSKCNTCVKANHWTSICLLNGTKPKQRPRSQSREHKKNLTINNNIGENSTWKLMQYTTEKLRNKWKAWHSIVLIWPKEMKPLYSLTLNYQIEMASTSCVWRSTQGHKGTPYQFLHSVECSQKKLHADGFPNIKNNLSTKNW